MGEVKATVKTSTNHAGNSCLISKGNLKNYYLVRKMRSIWKTNLGEPENVVNEEQHILSLLITEVLGHGEAGQGDTGTGAGGLVHLAVYQRHLAVDGSYDRCDPN